MTQSFIVTGRQGQLGRDLVRILEGSADAELRGAFDRSQLDVSDREAVLRAFDRLPEGPPDWLVNAAAHTAVDRCEAELDLAMAVNGEGPGNLAELCQRAGAGLIQVSTDYVFAGDADVPYEEDDEPAPRTAYGRSKLEGERRVLKSGARGWVVRTSWVFGPGRNFVGAILGQALLRKLGKVAGPLRVVDDQVGCPTYSADLAAALVALANREAEEPGLLHLANSDPCSWWDFARAILDQSGFDDLEIERGRTADLDLPAPRPRFSVLDCSKAMRLGLRMRSWREALSAYLGSPDGERLHAESQAAAEAA